MNILESLKKYIRANGGSSRANNISEAVKDLDSIPQGSGGGMFVTVTFHESFDDGTADKTVDEIIAAVLAGKEVKAKLFLPVAESVNVLNFSMLDASGLIFFGSTQYSPSKDGNYPMLSGMIDDGRDVWTFNG